MTERITLKKLELKAAEINQARNVQERTAGAIIAESAQERYSVRLLMSNGGAQTVLCYFDTARDCLNFLNFLADNIVALDAIVHKHLMCRRSR